MGKSAWEECHEVRLIAVARREEEEAKLSRISAQLRKADEERCSMNASTPANVVEAYESRFKAHRMAWMKQNAACEEARHVVQRATTAQNAALRELEKRTRRVFLAERGTFTAADSLALLPDGVFFQGHNLIVL